jgi:hypothetical protein
VQSPDRPNGGLLGSAVPRSGVGVARTRARAFPDAHLGRGSQTRPVKSGIAARTKTGFARLDSYEQVVIWRIAELDRAGYDNESAVALALRTDVDLHLAVGLLERGCPVETAVRILL